MGGCYGYCNLTRVMLNKTLPYVKICHVSEINKFPISVFQHHKVIK